MNGMSSFFIKSIPLALAALASSVVQQMTMLLNGRRIPRWKMFASTIIAMFVGVGAGHLVEGYGDNAMLWAAVASGIVGEKLILWVTMNSSKLFGDIWGAVLGRFGYKKTNTNEGE